MKAAVFGTGIAGLTTAEMLSRNDWTVQLFDVNPYIGGDASLATQNWHHTGWLYAGMPQAAPMKGCARALELLPQVYGDGRWEQWIRQRDVLFAYAMRGHELRPMESFAWRGYVAQVVLPRMRRLGLGGQAIRPPLELIEVMNGWDGPHAYMTVKTTDGELDTRQVLADLTGHIEGGPPALGREAELTVRQGWTVVDGDADYDLVVLASGAGIPKQLRAIGEPDIARAVTSVVSPVVVLDEPLDLPNFIRYTPKLAYTVNHMRFRVTGGEVSTLGAYDYWPVDEWRDPQPFAEKVCGMLGIPTSRVDHTYYATKTEYADGSDRRYNHAVVRANRNTVMVVPGKFSQFPLLAVDFAEEVPGLKWRTHMLRTGPPLEIGELRALRKVPA